MIAIVAAVVIIIILGCIPLYLGSDNSKSVWETELRIDNIAEVDLTRNVTRRRKREVLWLNGTNNEFFRSFNTSELEEKVTDLKFYKK
jgi:hypothetical protein